MIGTAHFWQST